MRANLSVSNSSKIRILYVEDDRLDCIAFTRYVKQSQLPYEYTLVGSVAEALAILESQKFQIVVLDYLLRDGYSSEIFPTLQSQHCPFIILTGRGDEETAIKLMNQGASDYLIKDSEHNYLKILPISIEKTLNRHQIERRLNLLNRAMQSIEDGIYIIDESGLLQFINDSLAKLSNISAQEAIGQPVSVLAQPQLERWLNSFDTCPISGNTIEGQIEMYRNDGTSFFALISESCVQEQSCFNRVGLIRDITPLKQIEIDLRNSQENLEETVWKRTSQLEKAIANLLQENQERLKMEASLRESHDLLQKQQEFFRLVIDSNPNFIFIKDWEGRFVLANKAVAEFNNTTVEEILGKTDAELHISSEESDRYLRENRLVIETQQNLFLSEEKAYREHIGEQWQQWQKRPIRLPNSDAIGVLGVGISIDEIKKIETSLRESQQIFASLAEAAPVGIFRTDQIGDCIYVNDRWCQIAGLNAEEVAGGNWARALHPDDREMVAAAWYEAVQANRPFKLECRFLRPDGVTTWVFSQALAERNIHGEIIGYVGTITDISDRKRAELTLQKIITGTAAVTGEDFFPALVRHIAEALDISYAIITELVEDHLQTLGFWANGSLQPAISYIPARTPCEISLQEGEYHCEQCVQALFPEDFDLVMMNAESYLGISLRDEHGNGIGNLCILDTKPISEHKRAESISILQVFAARASAELQRKTANDRLQRWNQDLEMRVQQRTKELQEREQFLKTVLDTFPLFVFWKDRELAYLGCNQKFAISAGVADSTAVIGKTDYEMPWAETEADLYRKDDASVIASGSTKLGIIETQHRPDGQTIWLETNKLPLRDLQGEIIGVLGTYQDISDRKHAEEKLRQTNDQLMRATRLKDEFLANMSHELRTPLNAILGMTESLQEEIFGAVTPEQIKALQLIETSGNHLLSLIDDILDLSKIEAGQITLDLKTTSIDSLCSSSLSFVQQQSLQKHIHIETKFSQDLPEIRVDERRIRQVLINLLNNAVKFTPEGGKITIEVTSLEIASHDDAQTPQKFLRIAVRDTGIGIAPDNIEKLFQPFVQIDSALNRKYNGTGLGLALTKRIIELHGGWVDLTSELGVGSCFAINLPYPHTSLPLTEEKQPSSLDTSLELVPAETDSAKTKSKTESLPLILLAEDNDINIMPISNYLKAKGYRMIIAKDGKEAVDLVLSAQPDLVLMDIQMPKMNGIEAIKLLRSHNLNDLPIIAVTALNTPEDRARCLDAGANEYLAKPVKLKQLETMIQSLLLARTQI
ncbi:PAS domain S-box protein [Pseudanabaena yagii]|uniref:histidine kinase n=1 Tax=Pseudanabaena yagii GIHE-NHR1 TaxID=2722753 RepID=A0ABX1LQQ4_9CYAN|nr:PAS domain S-box protein [Pseudanabaena yagii]NMF57831.1 PAS domain S-box protein [Pseudanabaena yagii GIHE-NHR1]